VFATLSSMAIDNNSLLTIHTAKLEYSGLIKKNHNLDNKIVTTSS